MFIKLTDTYFNVDRIAQFYIAARNKKTVVCYSNTDETFEVDETPEEILALIEAERVKELRDEFARAVLPKVYVEFAQGSAIARACYLMADAMLKAREVK